jgi:hypothetical protein
MADPTDDDVSAEDDAADVEAADAAADEATVDDDADGGTDVTTTKPSATRRRPDPRADVAARRAATKARMDAEAGGGKPNLTKAPAKGAVGTATADDPTGTKARRQAAASAKKVARPSKRTGGADAKAARTAAARSGNPKKAAEATEPTRYTAPIPRAQLESPVWVPAIMFTLLGAGGLVVLLTYVLWNGRPLTLGVGLALILGGIMTATQYR